MQSAYLLFDFGIFAVALLATLTMYRDFWRHPYQLLDSLVVVALPWILLDIGSHYRGWWEYNPQYTLGVRFFGLPLEEIIFFFVVPFASAVVWHVLGRHIKGWVRSKTAHVVLGTLLAVLIALLAFFVEEERTLVDAGVAILTVVALWDSSLPTMRQWWVWNVVVLGLLVVGNLALSSTQIVMYNPHLATGWQIGAMPLEDVIYNFSLLNLFLLAWQDLLHRRVKRA